MPNCQIHCYFIFKKPVITLAERLTDVTMFFTFSSYEKVLVSNEIVYYVIRETKVYFASVKFDVRAKRGQQSHE